jgi:hypothetical protein
MKKLICLVAVLALASVSSAFYEDFEGLTVNADLVGQNGWVAADMDNTAQSAPHANVKQWGIGGSKAGSGASGDWNLAGKEIGTISAGDTALQVSALVYVGNVAASTTALRIGSTTGGTQSSPPAAGSGGGVYMLLNRAWTDIYYGTSWTSKQSPAGWAAPDLCNDSTWYSIRMTVALDNTMTWELGNVDQSTGALIGVYTTIGTATGVPFAGDETFTFSFYTYDGDNAVVDNITAEFIPEPATIALLGLGALTLIRKR